MPASASEWPPVSVPAYWSAQSVSRLAAPKVLFPVSLAFRLPAFRPPVSRLLPVSASRFSTRRRWPTAAIRLLECFLATAIQPKPRSPAQRSERRLSSSPDDGTKFFDARSSFLLQKQSASQRRVSVAQCLFSHNRLNRGRTDGSPYRIESCRSHPLAPAPQASMGNRPKRGVTPAKSQVGILQEVRAGLTDAPVCCNRRTTARSGRDRVQCLCPAGGLPVLHCVDRWIVAPRVSLKPYLGRNNSLDTAVTLSIAIYDAIQHRAIHSAEGTIKSGR